MNNNINTATTILIIVLALVFLVLYSMVCRSMGRDEVFELQRICHPYAVDDFTDSHIYCKSNNGITKIERKVTNK